MDVRRLCMVWLVTWVVMADWPYLSHMSQAWGQAQADAAQLPAAAAVSDERPAWQLSAEQERAAINLGRLLRCPVCQGMPIGESPAPMAQDMMRRVRQMLAEGQSEQTISSYFVARYGDWVLLEPTVEGLNLLLWWLPPAIGLAAVLLLWWWNRQQQQQMAALPRVSATAPLPPLELPAEQYEQLAATLQQKVNE